MQMVYEVLAFQTPGIWMLVSDLLGYFCRICFWFPGFVWICGRPVHEQWLK